MVDPINYGALLTQINLAPLQQAAALRQEGKFQKEKILEQQRTTQLARTKFEYDQQRDTEYKNAVEAYLTNPASTPQDLFNLEMRFPDQSGRMAEAGQSYRMSQQQDMLGAGMGAIGALAAGKNDLAIKTLQDRVTALQNSGVDTSHTQAAIDMIKSGNVSGARNYLSYVLSPLTGAEHMAAMLDSFGVGAKAEDRRADNERQAAQQAETARHNRVTESQGAARVDLSRQAGARAAANVGKKKGKAAYSDADLDALLQPAGSTSRKPPTGFVLD
jgi:hypothetical protein